MKRTGIHIYLGVLLWLLSATGCSTRQNTTGTRFYHALTTRYNVYHNGREAYREGVAAQQQGNRDNYMELLPLYPVGNKATTGIGTAHFDRAIEKAQKAIRQHSIKRRPTRTPGKAYTTEYRQWLQRREFNPFMHRAWMLLGMSQYQKGNFTEAAATFAYVARLYNGQTGVTAQALIHLAHCYSALGWHYDAEDALHRVQRDSLPPALRIPYAAANAHLLLTNGRYREALPHLEGSVKHESNRLQKARNYYLLGQLYQQTNQSSLAYTAYQQTIRLNPPYELALSARIRQTEVVPPAQARKMTLKLQRLTREEKNREFLDQILYATGNIHLAQKDTAQALKAYHEGAQKSVRNGVEKGLLLLTLGNLYWHREQFQQAATVYSEAIGLLNRQHKEYQQLTTRSEMLDQLVPHLQTIELQDSLQQLAALSPQERATVIEARIAQVKAQEEQARQKAQKAAQEERKEKILQESPAPMAQTLLPTVGATTIKEWYFYNPMLVEQGKKEFLRQWGKRTLEDNWRRRNKTVVSLEAFEQTDYNLNDALQSADSLPTSLPPSTEQPSAPNTDANELHQPNYYLKQLPLTEEAMQQSNQLLSDALFQAGILYKDLMQHLPRAEATLQRLVRQYPTFAKADEAYYQLFLLELATDYHQPGHPTALARAQEYKQQLLTRFPQSRYARIVADPDFVPNARHGKQREDSLYAQAYTDYQQGRYQAVSQAAQLSSQRYPLGQHRPKFLFLEAVVQLQAGRQSAFLEGLKTLVRQYPQHEITELAAHILKGVQAGKLLAPATGNALGSIWQRRTSNDIAATSSLLGDTLRTDTTALAFTSQRQAPFLFILAYEEGRVNEHTLLYEVARYNFASFLVKDFDLSFAHERGIGMMHIGPFANYDEAKQYLHLLYANPHMAQRLEGLRAVLISQENYQLLIKHHSFDDYDAFYRRHFASIPQPQLKGYTLDEPLQNLPPEEKKEDNSTQKEDVPENGVIFED